jgi:hypothetical protein
METLGKQPRRTFIGRLLSYAAVPAALLLAPRRTGAEIEKAEASQTGPILYRRTEEAERYYRTLYR